MRGRTPTALGIDIDVNRVSLALVAREAGGFRVVRSVSRPISSDAPSSHRIEDITALSRTLGKLKKQCKLRRMKAAMGVSISPLVLQILDLPRPMPPNIREFVESELGQYVALSGKAIVSDFCAVGAGRDPQRRLLSVAGDKQTICDLVKACGSARLTVETVEPSILAYARARCRQTETGARADKVLVVEVNARQLFACLLRKGVLDFVRTKSSPTEVESSEAASAWLVEEIETMMHHYDSESSEGDAGWEVDIIARDGARVTQEITEFLKAKTGVLPHIVRESDGSNHAGAAQKGPGGATVALGLAMKLLDEQGDAWRINLLPHDVSQARLFARHVLMVANAAALIFLGMVLSLLFVSHTADRGRQNLDCARVAEKLYTTPALVAETRSIDRQTQWAQRQLKEIENAFAEQSQVDWPRVLNAVADSTPAGVCITRLSSQDAAHLSIRGLALSSGTVQGFVQALGKAGLFESVSLGSLERLQGGDSLLQYEMDCLMRSTP